MPEAIFLISLPASLTKTKMACLWSIYTPTLIDIVRAFLCQVCFDWACLPDHLGYLQMWPLPTNPLTIAACQGLRNAQTSIKDTPIIP
jgi:hypothetical protein